MNQKHISLTNTRKRYIYINSIKLLLVLSILSEGLAYILVKNEEKRLSLKIPLFGFTNCFMTLDLAHLIMLSLSF